MAAHERRPRPGERSLVRSTAYGVVLVLMLAMTCARPVMAEEITVGGELKGFSSRLLGEGSDFATTPFSLRDGNLFWTLAVAGAVGLTYGFDTDIRDKVQGSRSRGLDKAADVAELAGNPYLHIGVAALVYGGGVLAESPKWKEIGEMMAEALFLADAATLLIKEGTGRGRPAVASGKGDLRPLQFKTDYDSFPSMHTASSFAMASVIARTSQSIELSVLSYTLAASVGFARMNQNKHWASDVLLGAALGELAGRVVTHYHADKSRRFMLLPSVSGEAATMNLVYRF
ncbi:phosphatase PAP2 family protein [Trichlorobacter ammonificans]|uniref:Phosphoesterase PA-phosphatase related n=1 Tax=Trichlorobacter ammonificans TaxID=2916410 RepID=A0ABM9DAV1_9BACT|nr:phosphatase PAP2 family protein [Trichlorobacter ammonificans]CAH2032326.1 Phosphoesterase PA-phosphatase related [Trichlorobacter ammonificans]